MWCHFYLKKKSENLAEIREIWTINREVKRDRKPVKKTPGFDKNFVPVWGLKNHVSESWNLSTVKQKFFFIEDKSNDQNYFENSLKKIFCAGSINNCLRCWQNQEPEINAG